MKVQILIDRIPVRIPDDVKRADFQMLGFFCLPDFWRQAPGARHLPLRPGAKAGFSRDSARFPGRLVGGNDLSCVLPYQQRHTRQGIKKRLVQARLIRQLLFRCLTLGYIPHNPVDCCSIRQRHLSVGYLDRK